MALIGCKNLWFKLVVTVIGCKNLWFKLAVIGCKNLWFKLAVIGCKNLWFNLLAFCEKGDAATLVAASGKKWTLF
jgi:hypothetical protein